MKNLFTLITFIFTALSICAQAPEAISFQAIARDMDGNLLKNTQVTLEVNILEGSSTGDRVYSERHAEMTNDQAVFSFFIGNGFDRDGSIRDVEWGTDNHFLNLRIDATNQGDFQDLSTIRFVSVPYALHAATAEFVENVDDADASPSNELINTITLNSDNNLIIQEGDEAPISVDLGSLANTGGQADNWGNQSVISDSSLEGDGTSSNSLGLAQQGANNGQVLKWNGGSWVPSDDEIGNLVDTDDQQLQNFSFDPITGILSIALEDGGSPREVDLSTLSDGVEDDDADPNNEIQTIGYVRNASNDLKLFLRDADGNITNEETFSIADTDAFPTNELIDDIEFNPNTYELTIYEGTNQKTAFLDGVSPWEKDGNNIYYDHGYVGIGTKPFDADLHIFGRDNNGGRAALKIESQANNGQEVMLLDGDEIDVPFEELKLQDNNDNDVLMVRGGGNVGIGVDFPQEKLHVLGQTQIQGDVAIGGGPDYFDSITEGIRIDAQASSWDIGVQNDPSENNSGFYIGKEREDGTFHILRNGRVGIGTTNPSSRLHVNGDAQFGNTVVGTPGSLSKLLTLNASAQWDFIQIGSGNEASIYLQSNGNQHSDFVVSSNGNMGVSKAFPQYKLDVSGDVRASAFVTASDQRFKKDISKLTEALDIVQRMNAYRYTYRTDEFPEEQLPQSDQVGFLAQEIQELLPEVVFESKNGMLSISYDKLTPLLVEAIKEQQVQIEAFTQEKEAINRELAALKAQVNEISTLVKTAKLASK